MTALFPPALVAEAERLVAALRARGTMVATAESCTGGLVAALLTEVPGSSAVLERGFVVYANAAKQELLGVPEAILVEHGAVSAPTAAAMVAGALLHSRADRAVAITGIAGPDGGSPAKPVGLVHLAVQDRGGAVRALRRVYAGDRCAIRLAAVADALALLAGEAEAVA